MRGELALKRKREAGGLQACGMRFAAYPHDPIMEFLRALVSFWYSTEDGTNDHDGICQYRIGEFKQHQLA